jgi:hypothetical protein
VLEGGSDEVNLSVTLYLNILILITWISKRTTALSHLLGFKLKTVILNFKSILPGGYGHGLHNTLCRMV